METTEIRRATDGELFGSIGAEGDRWAAPTIRCAVARVVQIHME